MVWRTWRWWSWEYCSSFCTITLFFFSRLPLCLSCPPSWLCSFLLFQFHNKVTCFMLHHIEEPCSLGAHAAVIVPPTWIIKVKKPQVTACWCLFLKLSGCAGPVWLCRASLASLLGPPSRRHACSTRLYPWNPAYIHGGYEPVSSCPSIKSFSKFSCLGWLATNMTCSELIQLRVVPVTVSSASILQEIPCGRQSSMFH